MQAAARWHADLIAGDTAEPAAPPADPVVSVGGSIGAETGGAVAPFGVSSVAVGRPVQVVAVRLGVTPRRVRQLIASGALVAERVGRSWLIESASVDDYEAHRLTKGNRSA